MIVLPESVPVKFIELNPCAAKVVEMVGLTKVPATFTAKGELPIVNVPFPVMVPVLSSKSTLTENALPRFENDPAQLPVGDTAGATDSLLEQPSGTENRIAAATGASARLGHRRIE